MPTYNISTGNTWQTGKMELVLLIHTKHQTKLLICPLLTVRYSTFSGQGRRETLCFSFCTKQLCCSVSAIEYLEDRSIYTE